MAAVAVYLAHLLACIISFWSVVGRDSGGFDPVGKFAGGGFLRAFPTTAEALQIELAGREDGVLLIEWGDVVAHGVPNDHLLVQIEIVSDGERCFRLTPSGRWVERPLRELTS